MGGIQYTEAWTLEYTRYLGDISLLIYVLILLVASARFEIMCTNFGFLRIDAFSYVFAGGVLAVSSSLVHVRIFL